MFDSNYIDKKNFSDFMDRLKRENTDYKLILQSKKYKMGNYMFDFLSTFKSLSHLKLGVNKFIGRIRWRRLCSKFPIKTTTKSQNRSNYFSNEKIAIYTCIFGNYDIPQEPLFIPDNCDFYIITDQQVGENSVWKRINPEEYLPVKQELTNVQKNRYFKMLPQKIFKDYKYSIYVDGNIKVISDLTEFINYEMPQGILFHNHKSRDCVYDEIEACRVLRRAPEKDLYEFKEFLLKENFPRHFGLVECNVIVRDHTNINVSKLMNDWWDYFNRFSVKRDQLSMAYLLWKHSFDVATINGLGSNVQENPAIRVVEHN